MSLPRVADINSPSVELQWRLTHVELAEEFQPRVALRWGILGHRLVLVELQDGLFDVPLGHHPVPLVVVEGRVGVHGQLHGPVAHVEGEGDDLGRCGRTNKDSISEPSHPSGGRSFPPAELIPLVADKPKKSWFTGR